MKVLHLTVEDTKAKLPMEPPASPWPEDGLEHIGACPVCASTLRTAVHRGLKDRLFFSAPGSWDMHRCGACGSGYLDPRPDTVTIGLAYASYYTHSPPIAHDQSKLSRHRLRRVAQRNAYLNTAYGYDLQPASSRLPFFLRTDRRQRWDKHVGYLRFPGQGARLLDVGCGNGKFVAQMQSVGWEAVGIDPDPVSSAQAAAAGLNVRSGSIETLPGIADNFFDAVSLHHVIEHLHSPLETLRRCYEVLKPGGRIVIATPNFSSFGHNQFGPDWFALSPPMHLVMFTPNSLRRALEAAGFEPESECRTRIGAKEMFQRSQQIARRSDPMRMTPRLSLADRIRIRLMARRADRATRANQDLAEELVLLARRP